MLGSPRFIEIPINTDIRRVININQITYMYLSNMEECKI